MAEQKEQMIDNQILQSVVDYSFDAVISTDSNHQITLWNSAAEKLFTRSGTEVIGKSIYEIIDEEVLRNAEVSSQNLDFENNRVEYRRPDGKLIPLSIAINALADDRKMLSGYLYIVRDLTDVVGLEDAIQEKNRAMDLFMYSVSHDLRAPLRRVINYAEILQEDHKSSLTPDVQRVIERIAKNTAKMTELLDALVSYSRLSQAAMHKTKVDLNSLLDSVIDSQKKIADTPDVSFVVSKLPEVMADFNLLKLVWGQLISNAIKFSRPTQQPVIEIRSSETKEAVTLSIKDNGAGFDMQYAGKLFSVFQRLHNPAEFEGAGIGLAMVHQIITRHKGTVWAEGKVNEGATFYFSIPK